METQDVRIDRFEIIIRGVSPRFARLASEGLGKEVLTQLVDGHILPNIHSGGRINRIEPEVLKISKAESPSELRKMIACRIAHAVSAQGKRELKNER